MTQTDEAVTVYYKPGCPYSTKLRAKMAATRLPHRAVRFTDDPEGAAAVRAHHPEGWEVSPTVVVGGRYLTNPSLREVREAMAGR
ncbi:glutaredoxin family protein [Geodermatophilus sp. SYSU D00698]